MVVLIFFFRKSSVCVIEEFQCIFVEVEICYKIEINCIKKKYEIDIWEFEGVFDNVNCVNVEYFKQIKFFQYCVKVKRKMYLKFMYLIYRIFVLDEYDINVDLIGNI